MFSVILVITDHQDIFVSSGLIQQTVNSIFRLHGDYELILVNNYPSNLSPQITHYIRNIVNLEHKTKVIETNKNLGSSGGFNRGVSAASSESKFVVFVSEDAEIVDSETLLKMQRAFEKNPSLGLLHPVSIFEDQDDFNFSPYYWSGEMSRRLSLLKSRRRTLSELDISQQELSYIIKKVNRRSLSVNAPLLGPPLTFLVIRREVFNKVNGFDEKLFFCYEHVDFNVRALLAGYQGGRLNNCFVNHRRLFSRAIRLHGKPIEGISNERLLKTREHWNKKWGKKLPIKVYYEIRYGKLLDVLHPFLFIISRARGLFQRIVRIWYKLRGDSITKSLNNKYMM